MDSARFFIDPNDPRAPAQDVWDRMTTSERADLLANLPSEIASATPPEGDAHRVPKETAHQALQEHFRRIRKRVYLSSELPVYYPSEPMFAPDLIAVVDVEPHERSSWVVSQEKRGLDFVLEIHLAGSARKDFETNVERFARLGIPEYFAYDARRRRLLGWRLPSSGSTRYESIVPQGGRWASGVLALDLGVDERGLRFFHGSSPLLDAQELLAQLSSMLDATLRRAEDEARRAEDEARRAEDEARRAEKLAARLRELGVDPDAIE